MIKYTIFSAFEIKSMTFVIMIINTIYFFFTLFQGGIKQGGSFLESP